MKIDLLFPLLPPAFDAIGEHTALLARHLAEHARVGVVTGRGAADPVPGVEVVPGFDTDHRSGFRSIGDVVARRAPDWLVIQYNPFSYGRRGVNPYMAATLARLRRRSPRTRIALVVHEISIEPDSWRKSLMFAAQRFQIARLLPHIDLVLPTIEAWVPWFERRVRGRPVIPVPIGSNITRREISRSEARTSLDLDPEAFLVGVFGKIRPERRVDWVVDAVQTLRASGMDARILYVGPDTDRLEASTGSVPFHSTGTLAERDVPIGLCAMDVCATPFRRGVSGRRGSFIAALQHGLATLSTSGDETDAFLAGESGRSFQLVPDSDRTAFVKRLGELAADPTERGAMGTAARHFHDHNFAWDDVARRILEALSHAI